MTGMKSLQLRFTLGMVALALATLGAARTTCAQKGAIEFTAQVTPANGSAEPVRGLPFYVLKKSFEEIRKEVEVQYPSPDMNKFIDDLTVSAELKAWMKRNHSVSLTGDDFVHNLKPHDVMVVPEFFQAYVDKNSHDGSDDFPKAKFKEKDKTKNPDKYKADKQAYMEGIEKFVIAHPETLAGMDVELNSINPGPAWMAQTSKRDPYIQRQTMELARSRYFVAQTDTDLQGHGSLNGLVAGKYWLGTLDIYATVGDARLQWDTPVTVKPGQVTRVLLSNANAAEPVAANR
jgi:hypothetical protein